ncbi:MAG TPA: VOC family protein [Acidimicrobiia bacterium]|nr:VOC family protein [Acidimicrobiia bacterium]
MQVERTHQVAQRAVDLARAVAFYRDTLGLPLIAVFDPPGLAFFDLGNVRLLIEREAPSALLYLEVADIEATYAALAASGVETVDSPHLIFRDDAGTFGPAGTGEWMAFFRDSEGNLVGLVERRPPNSQSSSG